MFGMGFTEILLIAVIAILFLGPDKLPSTMVEIAKFFRSVKRTIGTVQSSIEEEMNVAEIKQEALAYKKQLLEAGETLEKVKSAPASMGADLAGYADDLLKDESAPKKEEVEEKPQEVTFKKKKKIKQEDTEENSDV